MKTFSMILVALFLFGGNIPADAQFGKLRRKIKNKVERKVDRKIDQKIDKTVDDVFEEAEGNDSDKKKKKKKKFDLSKMGMEDIELTEDYKFDIQIDWVMTSEEADEPIYMSQMMSEKNPYFGMSIKDGEGKSAQGTLIFDLPNEYLIIIPEGQKQAMVTSTDFGETLSDETMESQEVEGAITATGKQKKILGYTCQQYIFNSEQGEGEMWITKELNLPNHDLFSYMQKMAPKNQKKTPKEWEQMKDGFVLEMTTKDKDGHAAKLETIKIDDKANVSFDMEKYQAINITGMEELMGQ